MRSFIDFARCYTMSKQKNQIYMQKMMIDYAVINCNPSKTFEE